MKKKTKNQNSTRTPETISEYLAEKGFMSKLELYIELRYCRRVLPKWFRDFYCKIVAPFVRWLSMRPHLDIKLNKWARKIWIDKAIKKELERSDAEEKRP